MVHFYQGMMLPEIVDGRDSLYIRRAATIVFNTYSQPADKGVVCQLGIDPILKFS
jgi:hypothetical protein